MPHQVRSRLGRAYQMLFVLLAVVLPLQLLAPPAGAQVLPLRDAQGHPYGALLGFDTVTGLSCLPGPAAPTCATFTGNVTANSLPFSVVGSSTPITTGASSGNTAIPATSTLAVLTNNGSNDLYYKLGTSNAVTATSTDNLLAAGRSISVGVGTNTYIAAISPGGASTLYVVGGTGGSPSLSGGGGGSGGGGAVTMASGGVASGAYAAGSFAAGAIVDLGTGATPGANTTNGILKSLLTSNSGILGVDGATIATLANPFPTTAGLVAGTAVIGHVINDASSAVIGHVIADTGSTTAVTQATAANLNATVVGTGTLSVQNTAATPAGTNLIGKVGIDQTTTGTTNAVAVKDKNNVAPDFTTTAPTAQVGPYPSLNTAGVVSSATPETCSSGNVANATVACTLATASGKTTYITGFTMTADGATAGLAVTCTLTGTITGTMSYTFGYPTGATVFAQPLTVTFAYPVPASATNTTIVASCPASGAGGTNAAISATGFQL